MQYHIIYRYLITPSVDRHWLTQMCGLYSAIHSSHRKVGFYVIIFVIGSFGRIANIRGSICFFCSKMLVIVYENIEIYLGLLNRVSHSGLILGVQ